MKLDWSKYKGVDERTWWFAYIVRNAIGMSGELVFLGEVPVNLLKEMKELGWVREGSDGRGVVVSDGSGWIIERQAEMKENGERKFEDMYKRYRKTIEEALNGYRVTMARIGMKTEVDGVFETLWHRLEGRRGGLTDLTTFFYATCALVEESAVVLKRELQKEKTVMQRLLKEMGYDEKLVMMVIFEYVRNFPNYREGDRYKIPTISGLYYRVGLVLKELNKSMYDRF